MFLLRLQGGCGHIAGTLYTSNSSESKFFYYGSAVALLQVTRKIRSSLNGTIQPVEIEEEDLSPTMDR